MYQYITGYELRCQASDGGGFKLDFGQVTHRIYTQGDCFEIVIDLFLGQKSISLGVNAWRCFFLSGGGKVRSYAVTISFGGFESPHLHQTIS